MTISPLCSDQGLILCSRSKEVNFFYWLSIENVSNCSLHFSWFLIFHDCITKIKKCVKVQTHKFLRIFKQHCRGKHISSVRLVRECSRITYDLCHCFSSSYVIILNSYNLTVTLYIGLHHL